MTQAKARRRQAAPLAVLWCVLAMPAAYAVDPTDMGDAALQARYSALTHELRCVQCQAESIADSPVPVAGELRQKVADMLKAGKSDQDVLNYMRSRYGDYILFKPRSPLLWVMPGVLLAIGAAVAWHILRQRRGLLDTDNEPVEDEV